MENNIDKAAESRSSFYKGLAKLALPIIVQYVIISAVGAADTAMVGVLGEASLAAVSLGAQVFFLVSVCLYGVTSGGSVFFTRYFGANQKGKMCAVFGLCLFCSMLFALLGFAVAVASPYDFLLHYGGNALLAEKGAIYLQITAYSFPFSAVSFTVSVYLRSTGKSHYPMWVSAAALLIDVVFNYLLIFGKFGFPALGIEGAAWATLLARGVECLILVGLFFSKKNPVQGFKAKEYFVFLTGPHRLKLWKSFLVIMLPALLADLIWGFAQTGYKQVFTRMGVADIAALSAFESAYNLLFVFFYGFANAASIMIGQKLGKQDLDSVRRYIKRFTVIAFAATVPLGLLIALARGPLAGVYSLTGVAAGYFKAAALASGLLMCIRAYRELLFIGILRAGGDVKAGMWIQSLSIVFLGVLPAAFLGLAVKASFLTVFLVVLIEELCCMLILLARLKSGRWIKGL